LSDTCVRTCRALGVSLLAWFLCASACGAQSATEPVASDVARLAETLSGLGMHELLGQLVVDNQGALGIRRIDAEARITRATDSTDPDERTRLLEEAVELLEKELSELGAASTPEARITRFRLLLKLAVTQGLVQGEPHGARLLLLHGSPADRIALASASEKASGYMDRLLSGLRDAGARWRGNMRVWMVHGAELESLRDEATYRSGWIGLYRALSLPEGSQRTRQFRLVLDAVADFSDEGPRVLRAQSLFLSGIALRELGQHRAAGNVLREAAAQSSSSGDAIPIRFEALRNEIERIRAFLLASREADSAGSEDDVRPSEAEARSRFRQVLAGIDRFAHMPSENDPELALQRLLRASLLRAYVYETRAALEGDEAQAAALLDAARDALLDFMDAQPSPAVHDAFLDLLQSRWSEQAAPEDQSSIALLARAAGEQSRGSGGSEDSLRTASELLEILRLRDDPISLRLRPWALWRLALVRNLQFDNLSAAGAFGELAEGFQAHPLALPAARNAVQSLFGVIEERSAGGLDIASDLRRRYVGALERLVGVPEWKGRADVDQWNFQLAEQCELLYEQESDAPDPRLLARAVEAYQAVPAGLPESTQARSRALECRFRLLEAGSLSSTERYAAARKLREDLVAFADEAAASAKTATDPGLVDDLRRWGSEADFLSARAGFEFLGQRPEALGALAKLPSRWSGAAVIPRSEGYRIRKLVELGRTRQAIDASDGFAREFPAESKELLPLVIRQVRDRIASLRGQAGGKGELQRYRDNYLQLTKELHDRVSAKPLPERYWIAQTFADALVESGRAEEALALFQECRSHEQALRDERAGELDRQFEPDLQAIPDARSQQALSDLRARFASRLAESGVDVESSSRFPAVEGAWAYYLRADDAEDRAARGEMVRKAVREGLLALRESLKRRLPTEAMNLAGLAGAYHGIAVQYSELGRDKESREAYLQALRHYRQLLSGIDPSDPDEARLFWEAQLGFCECVLSGFSSNADAMVDLCGRIRGLHGRDPAMGGYYARFNAIEAEATRLSGG
jgi:hypothetical protein